MKSILRIAALASIFTLLGFCSIGCAPTVNPPTAPALGYVDSYDQQFGQVIAAATNFYTTIQNDINQGTYKPSAAELTALNSFGVALNVAKAAAQTYHNAPTAANLAPTQAAVNSVSTQQATLTAQIVGK